MGRCCLGSMLVGLGFSRPDQFVLGTPPTQGTYASVLILVTPPMMGSTGMNDVPLLFGSPELVDTVLNLVGFLKLALVLVALIFGAALDLCQGVGVSLLVVARMTSQKSTEQGRET